MLRRLMMICVAVLALAAPAGAATERILDFNSAVHINVDGSLEVTETITVEAGSQQIKRGIVREFPTKYKDGNGRSVHVGFSLLEVHRDGHPEPYHTEKLSNGIAVYAGDKDVFLKPGRYTYTFIYTTTRQLGFFKDHDELYWNVNGNGWRLPIDQVRCEVYFPEGAVAGDGWVYEGPHGSTAHFVVTGGTNPMRFESSRSYAPGEGMTIAVGWPKGFVKEPSAAEKTLGLLGDSGALLPSGIGGLVLFLYYLFAWFKVGRDPEKGVIIPRFAPPRGFSPAMVRMLWKMRFDNTAFTAGIVNLAVHGALRIEEIDSGGTLQLTLGEGDGGDLSKGERQVIKNMKAGGGQIVLKQSSHRVMGKARQAMKNFLAQEVASHYFVTNSKWLLPGILITVLTVVAMAWGASEAQMVLFISLWLTIWTFGCVMLVRQAFRAWKTRGIMGKAGAMFLTLFAIPFLIGELVGIGVLITGIGLLAGLVFLAMIMLNALFYELLKAPTVIGRHVLDEIDGFRMYLSVAEKERLNFIHQPEKTPELFEKFLPYAIALGVENEWGSHFEEILSATDYQPGWYSGRHWDHMHPAAFAGGLGRSMQSAVSAASTAPGSSSGVGGGGSSGGGGGGGGGGGW